MLDEFNERKEKLNLPALP